MMEELNKLHFKLITHDSDKLPEDIDKTISTVKAAIDEISLLQRKLDVAMGVAYDLIGSKHTYKDESGIISVTLGDWAKFVSRIQELDR